MARSTYQREVRLGVVLYGGVSLAVYENGVAQEFFRAMERDGPYELLKWLIDSDIVLDVISGTSAGGVNGIMLAFALAKKLNFAPSANLWREQGDIQQLLRMKQDPTATSILNSDYYQDKLQACFQDELTPCEDLNKAPEIEELDLFITGTDANGDTYTVYDDQGHAIDVKNHRALFKLAVRKGDRKNDLKDATPKELATLARLTSCFPAAFEPVRILSSDTSFFRWGKLRKPAVYLDGGILNNKPFTSTIETIAKRTANREVERFLIYVEPDPEVFGGGIACDPPVSPSVVQAAIASLTSIPGYQSIAGDLDAVQAHNEQAERIGRILSEIGRSSRDLTHRGADCLDRVTVLPDQKNECDLTTYLTCRWIQLRDAAVEGILNDANGRGYFASLPDRRSARILVSSFDYWPGDGLDTLSEFDIFFRMRRAYHLSRMLMDRVKQQSLEVETASWDVVNHYYKLYEVAQWGMVSWLNRWNYDWRQLGSTYPDLDTQPANLQQDILAQISADVWGQVKARLQLFLRAGHEVPQGQTSGDRVNFYQALKSKLDDGSVTNGEHTNLLGVLDHRFTAALKSLPEGPVAELLQREFCRFAEVDRQIFPIQMGSNFESTDVIRVVRFSPRDAQRGLSRGAPSAKVCGSTLGAFGGFFKKSWRANDIMIGRLDGACQLVECLLTKERLASLPKGRLLSAERLQGWFPMGQAEAEALTETINTYLANPEEATQATWSHLVDTVVAAFHRGIEAVEWQRVTECALVQEADWGRYRSDADRVPPVWNCAKHNPDQVLVKVAAHAIATRQIPPFQPGSVAGRPFLNEIPNTVIHELASLAGIRLQKSIVASIPNASIRESVERNKLHRWTLGIVLPTFYGWARTRRLQPEWRTVVNTAVPIACLTLIAALVVFTVHPHTQLALEVIAGSALVLAVWVWILRK